MTAARDIQTLTQRIAKHLNRSQPAELETLFRGASSQDLLDFRRL